jgi:hypothetical protein
MELGGYQISKGDKMWVPLHALHTSTLNFSEVCVAFVASLPALM